jgi:AhpD family alkylhydroperoxidase
MEPRLSFGDSKIFGKFAKHLVSASGATAGTGLPHATEELVKIRASQINGCAPCLDMHAKDAVAAGESQERLKLVAVWREASVFTDAERAALELAEQGTLIAGTGVTDEVWANAAKHYDDEQLAALVCQIAIINAFNRGNVMTRQLGGGYQPGQHSAPPE